jgi:hypothetical protein
VSRAFSYSAVAFQLFLAPTASATDVCTEFLTEHVGDPPWEQMCLDWLEQQRPFFFPFSSQAGSSENVMAASGPFADPPVHVSASDLALALGNQNEAFVAVDPSNPERVFYTSMTEPFSNGLLAAHSIDGGASWTPVKIAVNPPGPPVGSIPAGAGDPWTVWSDTGKLFFSYLADPSIDESVPFGIPLNARPTVVAKSSDGGASFEFVEALEPSGFTDRGSMATGPGGAFAPRSLWVVYHDQVAGHVVVRGAALDANGDPIEDFCGEDTGFFCIDQIIAIDEAFVGEVRAGHIAVGPGGEILASYFRIGAGSEFGPVRIFSAIDPDGLGPQKFPDPNDPSPPHRCSPPMLDSTKLFRRTRRGESGLSRISPGTTPQAEPTLPQRSRTRTSPTRRTSCCSIPTTRG